MAKHHAFGESSRTGGELNEQSIVGCDLSTGGVQLGHGNSVALIEEAFRGECPSRHLFAEHHDVAQHGKGSAR
ncbi:hypothetical protein D3C76_1689260 [compost metagenome]